MSDVREVEPGVFSILNGAHSYEVRIAGDDIRVNGRSVTPPAIEDSRAWNPRARGGTAAGGAQIKAPMPGKVIRVLVSPGEEVRQGQGIVVVEAMKMQNELKSPRNGRVGEIRVKPNDAVNGGTVLVTIE